MITYFVVLIFDDQIMNINWKWEISFPLTMLGDLILQVELIYLMTNLLDIDNISYDIIEYALY